MKLVDLLIARGLRYIGFLSYVAFFSELLLMILFVTGGVGTLQIFAFLTKLTPGIKGDNAAMVIAGEWTMVISLIVVILSKFVVPKSKIRQYFWIGFLALHIYAFVFPPMNFTRMVVFAMFFTSMNFYLFSLLMRYIADRRGV